MWQGWAIGSLLWLCVSCADGFIDGCIIMNFTQLFKIAPMTLLFIISFVVVMGIQLIQGVNIDEQTGQELIDYGANFLPLTLTDEPWRLVTAGFLHIGVVAVFGGIFAVGGGRQSVKSLHNFKAHRRAGRARYWTVSRSIRRHHGFGHVTADLIHV